MFTFLNILLLVLLVVVLRRPTPQPLEQATPEEAERYFKRGKWWLTAPGLKSKAQRKAHLARKKRKRQRRRRVLRRDFQRHLERLELERLWKRRGWFRP